MAFTDAQLMFSVSQASTEVGTTTAEPSSNVINLGLADGAGVVIVDADSARNIGVGDPLEIFVRLHNRGTLSASTMTVALYTHSAQTAVTTAGRVIWKTPAALTVPVTTGADTLILVFRVPLNDMSQFLQLGYGSTVDHGGDLEITSGIVHEMTQYRAYPSGLNFITS